MNDFVFVSRHLHDQTHLKPKVYPLVPHTAQLTQFINQYSRIRTESEE